LQWWISLNLTLACDRPMSQIGKLMQPQTRLSQSVQELFCCPICHDKLLKQPGEQFECTNSECATHFPIVDGIPVLINEQSSVFSIDDFISHRKTFFGNKRENKLKKTILSLIPTINWTLAKTGGSNPRF
jgi:uncharacterized protein YbaR (Trm112 family)